MQALWFGPRTLNVLTLVCCSLLCFISGLTLLSEHRRKRRDSIFKFSDRRRGSGDNRREKGELERWRFQPIALVMGAVLQSGGEGEGHC